MTPLTPPTADPTAALARFAATAPADVSYAFVDSPVGTMIAAGTERGLACLGYEDLHGGSRPAARAHRRRDLAARPARPGEARPRAARARRVLRGDAPGLRPRARPDAREALRAEDPRRDGADPVRRDEHLRRDRGGGRVAGRGPCRWAAHWAPTRSPSSSRATACSPATGRSTATRAGCTASSSCSSSRACSPRACDRSHVRNARTTVRSPEWPVPSTYDPECGSRPGLRPRREDAG